MTTLTVPITIEWIHAGRGWHFTARVLSIDRKSHIGLPLIVNDAGRRTKTDVVLSLGVELVKRLRMRALRAVPVYWILEASHSRPISVVRILEGRVIAVHSILDAMDVEGREILRRIPVRRKQAAS